MWSVNVAHHRIISLKAKIYIEEIIAPILFLASAASVHAQNYFLIFRAEGLQPFEKVVEMQLWIALNEDTRIDAQALQVAFQSAIIGDFLEIFGIAQNLYHLKRNARLLDAFLGRSMRLKYRKLFRRPLKILL